jgi:hypothetical protein
MNPKLHSHNFSKAPVFQAQKVEVRFNRHARPPFRRPVWQEWRLTQAMKQGILFNKVGNLIGVSGFHFYNAFIEFAEG